MGHAYSHGAGPGTGSLRAPQSTSANRKIPVLPNRHCRLAISLPIGSHLDTSARRATVQLPPPTQRMTPVGASTSLRRFRTVAWLVDSPCSNERLLEEFVQARIRSSFPRPPPARSAISVRTVEVHRARMMQRLGGHQLSEAIRLAVMAELAPPGPSDGGRDVIH